MPAEITRKAEFRFGPILLVIAAAFVFGYLVGVNAFAEGVPPLRQPCHQQPAQPHQSDHVLN